MDELNSLLKKLYLYFIKFLKQLSFKNLFNFQSLLKVIFLYCITLIYIIIFQFEFYPGFTSIFHKPAEYTPRIILYGVSSRIGEGILHKELLCTSKKIGWQVVSATFPESLTTYSLTKHFIITASNIISYIFKPDFTISTTHFTHINPYGFNLMYLNVPTSMLLDYNYKFKLNFNYIKDFDGYIDINSLARGNSNWLKKALGDELYKSKLIIPGYLTRGKAEYQPKKRDKALITGSLWGCNRSSFRFKVALKRLADEGYLEAIGLKEHFDYLGKAYKGLKDKHEFDSIVSQYGIGIIIHNQEHISENIPTNRIVEEVANSAIVISDRQPFVENTFKDNILYFDSYKNEDEIYAQIKQHIEWIKANPEKVEEKVKNAIKIFNEQLTLEDSLEVILQTVREFRGY
ncbi:MAG: hypothetical protein K0R02_1046 [Rickettsiaceae bacterium]|nr:hypothetical protein [Rickettsiaceae bacterium]